MIRALYLKFLEFFINIIDKTNKDLINTFLRKKFLEKKITIIDVGAHKGETLKNFSKNFHYKKIFCFEPNKNIFDILKKKFSYLKNEGVLLINCGLGDKIELRELNILKDSSSSTFSKINQNNKYYERKKKIINPFLNGVIQNKVEVEVKTISYFIEKYNISEVDLLKIDTEGFEFKILKGINKKHFKKINLIYFEHHYDLMLDKGYKFSDINKLLKENNFIMIYKIKMRFRKTFEYIYEKKN